MTQYIIKNNSYQNSERTMTSNLERTNACWQTIMYDSSSHETFVFGKGAKSDQL